MDKKYFDEVDTKVKFPDMEKELLDHWYEDEIVDKYLHKNDKAEKYFSFVDGPITANNPMGVHHAWGRTYKDLWQRYKNMQGFKQRFQNGFDSQGLWVEVEVEKDLGFKTKKQIEKYGVEKFVKKCKARVKKYADIQTMQSKRLGYFMDWDHSYFTMSDTNNYMIWHFLKVCHEKGWLYKGKESVPWCPRCETAISQHEMLTEDYKEVTHKSIYFELPIIGREREYLLVWTTTPWTLPANIAVAVDEKLDYALVKGDTGDSFWLAKAAVETVFEKKMSPQKVVKGSELVGLKYGAPFDFLPAVKKVAKENTDKFHVVIATDDRIMPINTEEGTGLVHTAVSAGTEDFKLGQKLGLPMIPVIADNADYLGGLGFLTGQNAKENPDIIFDYLLSEEKKEGVNWVFDIKKYKHRYPGCWRCKAELVWKVTDEWYIAMDRPSREALDGKSSASTRTLREQMIDVAKKITWIPEFGLKRELDWLNNMHDWLISKKNRYWGLSLPIWECEKCNYFEVIGGKEELRKKAVEGWEQFKGKTPHKPQIDLIKIACPKCGEKMNRVEPVGNPWLDAGIVAYSTISSNNQDPLYLKNKKEWRKWFPADFITESFPGQFKNWFYSMIAMSTVLENERPYKTVLGFATLLDETGKAMHKSWGNAIEFSEGADKIGVDVMRWMYARQNVSDNLLFGYNVANEVRRQFHLKIWNIYNFFVTYANLNGWKPDSKKVESMNPLDVWIKARLNQTTEIVTESLDVYQASKAALAVEDFVNDFSNWYIRRSRERASITATKQDHNDFYKTTYDCLVTIAKVLAPFTPFISDVIYTNLAKEKSVHLADWPKRQSITKEELKLIDEMAHVREIVEKGHAERKEKEIPVRQPLSKIVVENAKFDLSVSNLINEELNVKECVVSRGSGDLTVKLDIKITPELREEAKTRELIRRIQNERKKLGVDMSEFVEVASDWLPSDAKQIEAIKQKTLVKNINKGSFRLKRIK